MTATRAAVAELERLQAELARRSHATDPVGFARSLGITPDEWQAQVLTWTGRRLLLNVARQLGKSTTTALLALHKAIYTRGSLILIISPSYRQSKELLRKVRDFLSALPIRPNIDEENTQTIEFENGSRIVSLPSSEGTIRGFSSVDLIIEDEAGDVPDDLYRAVRPMLAVSNGALILMGTPKGRRGHFFKAWEREGAAWGRIHARADQCSRITAEFLQEERLALGAQFAQEYEGSFINTAEGLVYGGFDETRNVLPSLPNPNPRAPWTYVLGIDFGVINDTAFTVLAYRDHDPVVYVVASTKKPMSPDEAADETIALEKRYPFSQIVGDEGGLGKGFAEHMRRRFAIPIIPAKKTDKHGVIALLNGSLRRGLVQVVKSTCAPLIEEITTLAWVTTPEGAVKEAGGSPNHCADSFLYAWRSCRAYHNTPDETPRTAVERVHDEMTAYWKGEEDRAANIERQAWWEADVA